ncbi:MAG: TIGR03564 family F420-dependent LLM class oxidoreductase [Luteitalea sp.]|nr:TIGR03564 family F420-dependent LLM class oxidoreductase [Luteitalea sp.]
MSERHPLDPPSPFVEEWAERVATTGARGQRRRRALDVAMGRGRHAQLLAGAGWDVFGVDKDAEAVREAVRRLRDSGLLVRAWCADLTHVPLPRDWFELIVVTRYLQRDLFAALAGALIPGGVMIYETFTAAQRSHGRGPRSPDHLIGGVLILASQEINGPDRQRERDRRPRRSSRMQIGITINGLLGDSSLEGRIEGVRDVAERGFASIWAGEPTTPDPLTTFAVIGRDVPGIGLGTGIVNTYTRHPLALAGQALTVQAATGNRLSLGMSPSSRLFVERFLGYAWEKPGRRMREYLSALAPLLRGETVDYHSEMLKAAGTVSVPGASPPSLLISALGPVMLQIAGELADGTITAFTGPTALAGYVVPTITRAAAAAGRAAPRVVAIATVSMTADPAGARAQIAKNSGFLGQLPGYRAMLDREGVAGVEEVAIAGDEATVEREVRRYADAGATEFVASVTGSDAERARTIELLGRLASAGAADVARAV